MKDSRLFGCLLVIVVKTQKLHVIQCTVEMPKDIHCINNYFKLSWHSELLTL